MLRSNKKLNPLWIPTAASASLILLGACKDGDDTKSATDLLKGEWELTEKNGEDTGYIDGIHYEMLYQFQADGDFTFCLNWAEGAFEGCYDGEWSWITEGSKLEFSYTNDYSFTASYDLIISELTSSTLEGSWVDAYGDTSAVVLKKN